MTVAEVERELRLGRTRVYQLLRNGELPYVRIGVRAIRVTREDLCRWVEARHQGGQELCVANFPEMAGEG